MCVVGTQVIFISHFETPDIDIVTIMAGNDAKTQGYVWRRPYSALQWVAVKRTFCNTHFWAQQLVLTTKIFFSLLFLVSIIYEKVTVVANQFQDWKTDGSQTSNPYLLFHV